MEKTSALLLTAGLIAGAATTATASGTGTLPGGSTLTVEITSPDDGDIVDAGAPLTVAGAATVDLAPATKNTDVAFVLDVSGSTGDPSGVDCDGDAATVDTILSCEQQTVRQLVDDFTEARSPVLGIGIAVFPAVPQGSASAETVVLPLTDPADADLTVLDHLSDLGGTDFGVGLSGAKEVLDGRAGAGTERVVVLLTDGAGTGNSEFEDPGATIRAFAIAGAGCDDEKLQAVLQDGRDSCDRVTDLADLPEVIANVIGSSIDEIEVTVGNTSLDVDADLPAAGPAMVPFTAEIPDGLAEGKHTICAAVTGSEADQVVDVPVEDCVTVTATAPGTVIVDCAAVEGECTATAADEGASTLEFNAPPAFDEQVTIIPTAGEPGECAAADCRTGYDVLFPKVDGGDAIASITVITDDRVTLRERLRAAVFIDGERIRAECSVGAIGRSRARRGVPEPIPCKSIRYLRTGQLQYLVKFNVDPQFRFR